MKKYLSLLVILPFLMSTVVGQSLKLITLTSKYLSTNVIQIDSLKKDLLFSKTKEWITLNYKSAIDVIQLADKETGKIILKGAFLTNMFMKEGSLEHTLVFDFKDGKIRCSYTNFSYYSLGSGRIAFESKMMSKKKIFETTEENISSSIKSLKNYLIKDLKKSEEW